MEKERLTHELGSKVVEPANESSNEPVEADTGQANDIPVSEELNGTTASPVEDEAVTEDKIELDQTPTAEADGAEVVSETPEVNEVNELPTDTEEEANSEEEKAVEVTVDLEGPVEVENSDEAARDDQQGKSEEAPSDEETPKAEKESPKEIDYTQLSKDELLEALLSLNSSEDFGYIGKSLKEMKPLFDQFVKADKEEAQKRFEADGGTKEDFDYQLDASSQKFYANYNLLWDRKQKHFKNLEKQKDSNLHAKNDLLEELRNLVDGEESGTSINAIKKIQADWKAVGPVPKQHNRTLWANYHALMDRFYDNRSIYFELKELDRRKNLELKMELCGKAEALGIYDNVNKAVQELNQLHEEFKHIGPVPQENQEELWLRFKAASDTVYAKRRDLAEDLKEKLQENLQLKLALCEKIESFIGFEAEKISEWNEKTKEVLAVQQEWEKVGGLPRDKSKTVNKKFWSAFKGFFANKSKFFKALDGQREENLKLKEALVEKAESLKDAEDFNQTANLFKELQREWKEIGPVPDKDKNNIYKQFKSACDEFFDRKRASVKESEKEFYENLERKQALCDQLDEIGKSDKIDLDIVETLQAQWSTIGFVPRNELKKINKRYEDAVNVILEKLNDSDLENKDQVAIEIEIRKMKGRPGSDKSLHKQESSLRKQISMIENDISTWTNNLEFFRSSKNADQVKKDFDVKINAANEELKKLRKQLRMMETA